MATIVLETAHMKVLNVVVTNVIICCAAFAITSHYNVSNVRIPIVPIP